MRFSSIFVAALPILGSVFAAPLNTEAKKDLAAAPAELVQRDSSLLDILAELKADIEAAGSLSGVTAEVNITATVQVAVDALNKAGSALGADLSLGVDAEVSVSLAGLKREIEQRAVDKTAVAQVLVDIIATINVNILTPAKPYLSSCTCQESTSLIKELDTLLTGLLSCVDSLLGGILILVKGLLIKTLGLVSTLLGDLAGLLGDVLSVLGL
ncbi:hypothetical protein L202_06822 [Cryptococcus amylolentus CBS 6039]|uniref:Uncharacterized protein n=2 Tax=Cryptococcus amylolentus TaxID=104669 RepID=A0A1E3HE46_9TREE|nr:hypothetical protein L202_06822 [Cryptococcus amylolentus CBS 6039]ODN74425.1 hypothetical protein L202_06822 [Cryptococcus amylolentus CBS 6039]ODO01429.1 hypothetical protein I350_06248 [Cryptococcus amylolentus CBS 6273]